MSRPRFTKDYRTYGGWLKAQPRDTKYAKEIIRKHRYFPDKSLNQLRKLKVADFDLSIRPWNSLSEQDQTDRDRYIQILREVRKGKNFTDVLKKRGLKKGLALKHLGKNLYKSGRTWKVTDSDSIEFEVPFYDNNEGSIKIVTASSKDRSLIGGYFDSVDEATNIEGSRDPSALLKYKDIGIVDAEGKNHYFQTDLQGILDIMDAEEEPEFFGIYKEWKRRIKKLIKKV